VILVLFTNSWEVADNGNSELLEVLSITDTRAFQDLGGTESTTAQDDHLACTDNGLLKLALVTTVADGDVCNSNGLVTLKDDSGNTRVGAQVKVVLDIHDTMDIGSSSVAAPSCVPVNVLGPDFGCMGSGEVLNIIAERNAQVVGRPQEVLSKGGDGSTITDGNGTIVSMGIVIGWLLIVLQPLHEGKEILGCPSFGLEVIPVRCGGPGVHLEIDATSTSQNVCTWYDGLPSAKVGGWLAINVEPGLIVDSVALHVAREDTRPVNPRVVTVVGTSFDEHDLQGRIGVGQSTSDNGTCGTTTTDDNVDFIGMTHIGGYKSWLNL